MSILLALLLAQSVVAAPPMAVIDERDTRRDEPRRTGATG